MPDNTIRCPFCESPSRAELLARDRNRRCSDEVFEYRRCTLCDTVFLGNPPADLRRYYPRRYYSAPGPERLERLARGERFKLEFVLRWMRTGRLVEIGAGYGVFAWQTHRAGYDTVAIEMDPRSCAHLRNVVGVQTIQSDDPAGALGDLPSSRVVALWHTLEHLARPRQVLEAAAANLEPGGIVVVATPNPESFGFRVLQSRWPHLDAPRHLQLIPWRALSKAAGALGLDLVEASTIDRGARGWNEFAWRHALVPVDARGPAKYAAYAAGKATSLVLAPIERRGFRGSAYTAVFRKAAKRRLPSPSS